LSSERFLSLTPIVPHANPERSAVNHRAGLGNAAAVSRSRLRVAAKKLFSVLSPFGPFITALIRSTRWLLPSDSLA
jgi:hypothetical protein